MMTDARRTIDDERKLFAADMEQTASKMVDDLSFRLARLIGIALLASFVGVVALLFIARRLFRPRAEASA